MDWATSAVRTAPPRHTRVHGNPSCAPPRPQTAFGRIAEELKGPNWSSSSSSTSFSSSSSSASVDAFLDGAATMACVDWSASGQPAPASPPWDAIFGSMMMDTPLDHFSFPSAATPISPASSSSSSSSSSFSSFTSSSPSPLSLPASSAAAAHQVAHERRLPAAAGMPSTPSSWGCEVPRPQPSSSYSSSGFGSPSSLSSLSSSCPPGSLGRPIVAGGGDDVPLLFEVSQPNAQACQAAAQRHAPQPRPGSGGSPSTSFAVPRTAFLPAATTHAFAGPTPASSSFPSSSSSSSWPSTLTGGDSRSGTGHPGTVITMTGDGDSHRSARMHSPHHYSPSHGAAPMILRTMVPVPPSVDAFGGVPDDYGGYYHPAGEYSSSSSSSSSCTSTPMMLTTTDTEARTETEPTTGSAGPLLSRKRQRQSVTERVAPVVPWHSTQASSPSSSLAFSVGSPSRNYDAPVLRVDKWLGTYHDSMRYLTAFERHGWMFTPLHPLVLSEESMRAVLLSGATETDCDIALALPGSATSRLPPSVSRDIFLLQSYTAMAYGAEFIGNHAQADEFFNRARISLDNLLDIDDYAIAEAMFALGYYRYGRADFARFSYYITLGNNICQRIGAQNSGVSLKCMMAIILDPTYSPAEKERTLRSYNRALKELPRWEDHYVRFLLDYNRLEGSAAPDRKSSGSVITLGMSPQLSAADILATIERMQDVDKCITNILMLMEVHSWMKAESGCGRKLGTDSLTMVLDQWQLLLVVMKEKLESDNSLPHTFKVNVSLCLLCYYARYAQQKGDMKEAMRWGTTFLDKMQEEDVSLCTSSFINIIVHMLDFYLDNDRDDLFEKLLHCSKGICARYPVCSRMVTKYWSRLQMLGKPHLFPSALLLGEPSTSSPEIGPH